MNVFPFTVRTPRAIVFEQAVEQVVAPLPDGWIGIRAGRAPFIARLLPGQVGVRVGETDRALATRGGVLLASRAGVTVLTGAARVDSTLDELDATIDAEARQHAALETEAAHHFERLYRQMARAVQRVARP